MFLSWRGYTVIMNKTEQKGKFFSQCREKSCVHKCLVFILIQPVKANVVSQFRGCILRSLQRLFPWWTVKAIKWDGVAYRICPAVLLPVSSALFFRKSRATKHFAICWATKDRSGGAAFKFGNWRLHSLAAFEGVSPWIETKQKPLIWPSTKAKHY